MQTETLETISSSAFLKIIGCYWLDYWGNFLGGKHIIFANANTHIRIKNRETLVT